MPKTLAPEDLRPINRVMYATALIPGGKSSTVLVEVFGDVSP